MVSFFHPWLWLGALALAAPVWLHLRQKEHRNLIRFSAVQFLDEHPTPRRQPRRLTHPWLLALRVLGLLLLVCAFAWPYARHLAPAAVGESRVYILDNTLSQQAANGLDRGRARILSDLASLPAGVQVGVVELTSLPRVLVTLGESREEGKQKLHDLKPGFERGSYLAAFRQAQALLENSLGAKRKLIFLTDSQENQWTESGSTPAFLRGVDIEFPKPAQVSLPNLSLAEPRVQRIFLGAKSLANFTVKLSHRGPARTASVIFRANGQQILSRTFDLEHQPETFTLQAQWEADPGLWLRGEASVEGGPDSLAADDRVFFALPPVVEGKVALLAQSSYLRLALSPDIMRGQWATRVLEPSRLAEEVANGQDADVLCLESNYLTSDDARALVWRYLRNGRGVFLLVNRATPAVKAALRDLGFEIDGEIRNVLAGGEHFQFVLSTHPIFHPFMSPDFGNLMEIQVPQYFRLRATDALPLVFSESGAGLFFQATRSGGKLFVAAFGMDRDHTTWPIHPTFIPFLDLTLQAARPDDPTPTQFEPGEVATMQLPAGSTAKTLAVRRQEKELFRSPLVHGRAQFRAPNEPGIYELTCDAKTEPERIFAVNPSPKESELAFSVDPAALKSWKAEDAGAHSSSPPPLQVRASRSSILQQQWWWWMLACGLLALLLETIVAEGKRA